MSIEADVSCLLNTPHKSRRLIPNALLVLAFCVVAIGTCAIVLKPGFWHAIGVGLAIASTFLPHRVPAGWLLLILGASQLARTPSATDPRFYVLLAGLHLLQLLSGFNQVLPWHGRIEAAALVRPFRRFALVQLFAQSGAGLALWLFGGSQRTVRGLSLVSATLLVLLVVLLARSAPTGDPID